MIVSVNIFFEGTDPSPGEVKYGPGDPKTGFPVLRYELFAPINRFGDIREFLDSEEPVEFRFDYESDFSYESDEAGTQIVTGWAISTIEDEPIGEEEDEGLLHL
ncbi:hypothetical protein [Haloarchaeobius sp. DFWS5]|uniref:hypothetical protein n=1 Tax=Haloarchaeobius sp. DFWS5 TaxID=3446114 RepID=UPI003EBA58B8